MTLREDIIECLDEYGPADSPKIAAKVSDDGKMTRDILHEIVHLKREGVITTSAGGRYVLSERDD